MAFDQRLFWLCCESLLFHLILFYLLLFVLLLQFSSIVLNLLPLLLLKLAFIFDLLELQITARHHDGLFLFPFKFLSPFNLFCCFIVVSRCLFQHLGSGLPYFFLVGFNLLKLLFWLYLLVLLLFYFLFLLGDEFVVDTIQTNWFFFVHILISLLRAIWLALTNAWWKIDLRIALAKPLLSDIIELTYSTAHFTKFIYLLIIILNNL